jgi:hypothetical protein
MKYNMFMKMSIRLFHSSFNYDEQIMSINKHKNNNNNNLLTTKSMLGIVFEK